MEGTKTSHMSKTQKSYDLAPFEKSNRAPSSLNVPVLELSHASQK